jgi:uncharacterized Zn finger protein
MNKQFNINTRCPNCADQAPYSRAIVELLASLKNGKDISFTCSYCGLRWTASEAERKNIAAEIERRSEADEKAE